MIMEGTSVLRLVGAYCPRVIGSCRLGEAPRAGRTVSYPVVPQVHDLFHQDGSLNGAGMDL